MPDSKMNLLCSAEEPINNGCVDTNRQAMKPLGFFEQHPVFTHAEFAAAHSGRGRRSPRTTQNILAQHVAGGRRLRVYQGPNATPPSGGAAGSVHADSGPAPQNSAHAPLGAH